MWAELNRTVVVLLDWPITPLTISAYKDVYRVEAEEGSFASRK